ncbi:MAG TPA: Na+/H+ antiporter subunit E [Gammaproteobacteria bacterium]|nr:Na+/H+ antiporter subunit E [Gammaproteobacteria bacterium]
MARSFSLHLLALGLLWALLTGGATGAWLVGAPVTVLAAWAGASLAPDTGRSPRPLAALAFVPFFLGHSLRGAWDVARRAVHPRLPIDPGRITYPCRLPEGTARTFFANCVSLLPGTLFVADRDGVVDLHAIDRGLPLEADLAVLERRVAALFGVSRERRA